MHHRAAVPPVYGRLAALPALMRSQHMSRLLPIMRLHWPACRTARPTPSTRARWHHLSPLGEVACQPCRPRYQCCSRPPPLPPLDLLERWLRRAQGRRQHRGPDHRHVLVVPVGTPHRRRRQPSYMTTCVMGRGMQSQQHPVSQRQPPQSPSPHRLDALLRLHSIHRRQPVDAPRSWLPALTHVQNRWQRA
jgi:hypothetical protein